jgi:phosphoserine phosphatase RsbU/P
MIGERERGMPLTTTGNHVYKAATVDLELGDVVVLYTDAISEALDRQGNMFGTASVTAALQSAPPSAESAGTAILDAVSAHAAGRTRSDDMTLIGFGRDRG